jgi:hypothetical protein
MHAIAYAALFLVVFSFGVFFGLAIAYFAPRPGERVIDLFRGIALRIMQILHIKPQNPHPPESVQPSGYVPPESPAPHVPPPPPPSAPNM